MYSVSFHSHYQDDPWTGKCKRPPIRGLELGLAMPAHSMTNSEPSGSPDTAVAIAMKRETIDASEIADAHLTFRVGSGASLLLPFVIATLLSYAYSTFTMLSQHILQMEVRTSPMPSISHRVARATIRTCQECDCSPDSRARHPGNERHRNMATHHRATERKFDISAQCTKQWNFRVRTASTEKTTA